MKTKNATNTVLTAPSNLSPEPVTFRLPSCGGDPHFGLTKSFYYGLEAKGIIELLRLRGKGKKRGVTLVPFNTMKEIVFGGLAK